MRVERDGGRPVAIARGQDVPQGIAVDERSVYWVNFVGEGALMKVRK
jgi:hypothetical protein